MINFLFKSDIDDKIQKEYLGDNEVIIYNKKVKIPKGTYIFFESKLSGVIHDNDVADIYIYELPKNEYIDLSLSRLRSALNNDVVFSCKLTKSENNKKIVKFFENDTYIFIKIELKGDSHLLSDLLNFCIYTSHRNLCEFGRLFAIKDEIYSFCDNGMAADSLCKYGVINIEKLFYDTTKELYDGNIRGISYGLDKNSMNIDDEFLKTTVFESSKKISEINNKNTDNIYICKDDLVGINKWYEFTYQNNSWVRNKLKLFFPYKTEDGKIFFKSNYQSEGNKPTLPISYDDIKNGFPYKKTEKIEYTTLAMVVNGRFNTLRNLVKILPSFYFVNKFTFTYSIAGEVDIKSLFSVTINIYDGDNIIFTYDMQQENISEIQNINLINDYEKIDTEKYFRIINFGYENAEMFQKIIDYIENGFDIKSEIIIKFSGFPQDMINDFDLLCYSNEYKNMYFLSNYIRGLKID